MLGHGFGRSAWSCHFRAGGSNGSTGEDEDGAVKQYGVSLLRCVAIAAAALAAAGCGGGGSSGSAVERAAARLKGADTAVCENEGKLYGPGEGPAGYVPTVYGCRVSGGVWDGSVYCIADYYNDGTFQDDTDLFRAAGANLPCLSG